MDAKLLLVKTITLVYREKLAGSIVSKALVTDIINAIRKPNAISEIGPCPVTELKGTLSSMLELPENETLDMNNLLQCIRVNVSGDNYLYDAIATGINQELSDKQNYAVCKQLRNELRTHDARHKITNIIQKASTACAFKNEDIDWSTFVPNIINELESYSEANQQINNPALVGKLDFTDKIAIKKFMLDGKESVAGKGIMRTGWQGINEMTDGGLRRGELVIVGALKHKFKSGMLLNLTRHVIHYNKPFMFDQNRKPLVVHITLENEIDKNLVILYNTLWEKKYKKKSDVTHIDSEEMLNNAVDFISQEMSVNGYTFHMLRFDPSEATYEHLFQTLRDYEAENYEVHMCTIDYLPMMNDRGCSGTNQADKIRDLYRRCRNFCVQRNITLLTAHQLSSDAINVSRDSDQGFVKAIVGKSYYDRCRAVDHEADLELTIHIEEPGDGHKYLTVARGKHRKPTETPTEHLYTVYRFEKVGTIPDDIDTISQARLEVGADTVASGGAKPWFGKF